MRIFVIRPISADPKAAAKREILEQLIGSGLVLPLTGSAEQPPEFDLEAARISLQSVDLVIADLSFERPSCYFELGMAQALGVGTFLIAEEGTLLHQHSGNVRYYSDLDGFRSLVARTLSGYQNA